MRKWVLLFVVLVLAIAFAGHTALSAQESIKVKSQTECPVLNGKIDRNIYLDYQGKRVYFCCASCKDEFLKDPGKYLKQMESEGVTPENSPGNAPQ